MDMKTLKAKSKSLDPVVTVGKSGLTDSAIEQIRLVLKKKKLIKVKLLRSFVSEQKDEGLTIKQVGLNLCDKLGAQLVDAVGFVVVLYKR